ncbi:uncharacterized protein B0J16DRAFT_344279 [Fusarium flagelliforme]|uniref:uncharacterized protein n=1 Tax=Fusarium flagelliforme TaxID=2675880 RepID=UPI001E8DC0EF|nr:uncharacterized protein B0J16DRAFT_344279 [Fusarium flagelliforme]KAH7182741.1 hypothetical protein B0J16DRAFT_344279 [Fusarium flagelliforme]
MLRYHTVALPWMPSWVLMLSTAKQMAPFLHLTSPGLDLAGPGPSLVDLVLSWSLGGFACACLDMAARRDNEFPLP